MISDKRSVQQILAYLEHYDIFNVVISPGSRNGPFIVSFNNSKKFKLFSIVDERSAGFFALGMAQQSNKPVVLSCTSGTALLNYAPAIAEAYYQRIPLIVISADRPEEWLDHGIGQTIRQKDVFQNFINASVQLIGGSKTQDEIGSNDILLSQAFSKLHSPCSGPIHINVPLDEPLYDLVEGTKVEIHPKTEEEFDHEQDLDAILNSINSAERILVLTGLLEPNSILNEYLANFSKRENVIVMTETSSNLHGEHFFPSTDRMVFNFEKNDIHSFKPDVLITLGTNLVSKKIKQILLNDPPKYHWHIDHSGKEIDTFKCLSGVVKMTPEGFIQTLLKCDPKESDYRSFHQKREIENKEKHAEFLSLCKHSDLKAFEAILDMIPKGSMVQMGNSSVIRYIQLFGQREDLTYYSNRGTSGIDGCTSTAIGAAYISERPCTLISGDIAFFYDSNALWNKYIPENFKIVIMNNGGGGIFRIIPGPLSTGVMEEYFETRHELNAVHLAKMYGLEYLNATDIESTKQGLSSLYAHDKPAILEIFTPAEKNDNILRSYFQCLKQTKEQILTGELSKNTKT